MNTVGAESRLFFNPLSFIACGAGPLAGGVLAGGVGATLAAGALAGFGAVLGNTHFTIGSDVTLHYGSHVNIQRGPSPIRMQAGFHPAYTALATVVGALSIGASICGGLSPGFQDYVLWDIGAGSIKSVALAGLIGLETANAFAWAAKQKADAATEEARLARESVVGMKLSRAGNQLQETTGIAMDAMAKAQQALDLAMGVASTGHQSDPEAPIEIVTGTYDLHASKQIQMTAAQNAIIMATGPGGSVVVNANDFISVASGSTAAPPRASSRPISIRATCSSRTRRGRGRFGSRPPTRWGR